MAYDRSQISTEARRLFADIVGGRGPAQGAESFLLKLWGDMKEMTHPYALIKAASGLSRPVLEFLNGLKKQPTTLVSCILLFASSVALWFLYQSRVVRYESIISSSLNQNTENTAQSHKGLEAFILSNVRNDLSEDIKNSHFDQQFLSKYAEVSRAVDRAAENILRAPKTVELQLAQPGSANLYDTTYTDSDPRVPGYLFVPDYVVHGLTTRSHESSVVVVNDPAVARAVFFSRLVASALQQLSDAPIIALDDKSATSAQLYLQLAPAQIYLITTEGVNRVFNRKAEHPSAEYGNQFPATTFFPSRPYFWPALENYSNSPKEPKRDGTIGSFFRVSKPYLDLGGSGVVITLSHPIQVGGLSTVLCIDFQLDSTTQNNVYADLAQNIRALGGAAATLDCRTSSKKAYADCSWENTSAGTSQVIKQVRNVLETGQRQKDWSTISGNVDVFPTPGSESRLRFSVPMSQEFSGDEQRVRLMLIDVDLKAYTQRTSLYGLGAATCFGLMTVLLAYMWGSNVMQRRELEAALDHVADVMSSSPTPYIRLDADDRIRDASLSFCALLGIPPTPEGLNAIKHTTLRSYCADSVSAVEYDRIADRRHQGLPVAPYILELRRKDGSTVRVRVHSAALPSTGELGFPVTFGILVEQSTGRLQETFYPLRVT